MGPGAIEQIIAEQKKVNSYLKKQKAQTLSSVHITIDGFGDNMNVVKSNHSILNTLLSREGIIRCLRLFSYKALG